MAVGKENRPHIGIFGKRNNGKSSLINALTGQQTAIVSDVAGTTTDPVKKSIEIKGIGPTILIDTAGIDDSGELGKKRIEKTIGIIPQCDLAIFVFTSEQIDIQETELINEMRDQEIPVIPVCNKSDIFSPTVEFFDKLKGLTGNNAIIINSLNGKGIEQLIDSIKTTLPPDINKPSTLIGDLINQGDSVLLITPIDNEAPEGRLILPQVQVIRDILDNDGIALICKEREADEYLKKLTPKPALVITDSQVFLKADAIVPKEIPLTSFSIVLARQKGEFSNYLAGTPVISQLKDGDRVLMLESCTHQVSCDDIGRVKLPRWMSQFTGKKLDFDVVSGLDKLSRPIHDYALIVQCGGCVITARQLSGRLRPAIKAGIPVTNYGMAIAYMHGIFARAVAPFTKKTSSTNLYI